jgi:hypothetical protein
MVSPQSPVGVQILVKLTAGSQLRPQITDFITETLTKLRRTSIKIKKRSL